jgi:hypothetical protein
MVAWLRWLMKAVVCGWLLAWQASTAMASQPVFGSADDLAYAKKLWQQLETERIVGKQAIGNKPFFGGAKPHGMILELAYQMTTVAGHRGFVVVKKNYNGPGASVAAVEQNRQVYLDTYTVMFQREPGYDEENNNWFWVKYDKQGQVMDKIVGKRELALAGRVAKGNTPSESGGCIYCHSSAGGGDYIFYPHISLPGFMP